MNSNRERPIFNVRYDCKQPAGTWQFHELASSAAHRSLQSPIATRRLYSDGFTYIGLLIFIALMGIGLAGTGVVWHSAVQREKERELLFVGDQFRRAIGLYYERSPGGGKQFPQSLEDLLIDKRYPSIQRYLRHIYPDPITGKADWGLVQGPGNGIIGIYSLSEAQPVKRAGFPAVYKDFEYKDHYKEWRFLYVAETPPLQGEQPPGGKPTLPRPSEGIPSAPKMN